MCGVCVCVCVYVVCVYMCVHLCVLEACLSILNKLIVLLTVCVCFKTKIVFIESLIPQVVRMSDLNYQCCEFNRRMCYIVEDQGACFTITD